MSVLPTELHSKGGAAEDLGNSDYQQKKRSWLRSGVNTQKTIKKRKLFRMWRFHWYAKKTTTCKICFQTIKIRMKDMKMAAFICSYIVVNYLWLLKLCTVLFLCLRQSRDCQTEMIFQMEPGTLHHMLACTVCLNHILSVDQVHGSHFCSNTRLKSQTK